MTARVVLVRGMVVGVVAAALAYVFASLFGEPQVNQAIAFEESRTMPGMADAELVSRGVQSTLGLAVAVGVYGAALGGIFALAFAFAYGRLGRLEARATSLLTAGVGFVALFLVPYLKYPANPPAVGDPGTIARRTVLYFVMVALTVLAAVLAVMLARALQARLGTWNAVFVAAGAFLAGIVVVGLLLPTVNEVPAGFPATLLWRFRLASVGAQLVLWVTFGLLFGALTDRSLRRRAQLRQPATAG